MLSEKIGKLQSDSKVSLYSPYPFPWRKQQSEEIFQGPFANNAWKALSNDPNTAFYNFYESSDGLELRYAIADSMHEACIDCHNSHKESPKVDWRVGDLRGVLEVSMPIDNLTNEKQLVTALLPIALLALALILLLWITIAKLRINAKHIESSNQQLRIEKEKLTKANQAKSDFLACMSHEIRTPMNSVIGMLSLLGQDKLSSEQQSKIDIAKLSASSLMNVINDILDFSKIEAGKLEINASKVDIQSIVIETCQSIAFNAQEKAIELLIEDSQFQWSFVEIDGNRFKQILLNLLSNAIKFTDSGMIKVSIKSVMENQTPYVVCKVEDSGIGVAPEDVEGLFNAFTQADASMNRQFGGTGLGLSIAKQLCALMGGDIWLEPQDGKGSCFTFKLQPNWVQEHKNETSPLHVLLISQQPKLVQTFKTEHNYLNIKMSFAFNLEKCQSLNPSIFDLVLVDEVLVDIAKQWLSEQSFKPWTVLLHNVATPLPQEALENHFLNGQTPKPLSSYGIRSLLTQAPSHKLDNKQPDFSKICVLLVEDNYINQQLALTILESYQAKIVTAENGQEAIDVLSNSQTNVDLIFMDCQMPVMDGFEATKNIRTLQATNRYKDVPIIALTANNLVGDRENCLKSGMNDFISKPFEPHQLKGVILKFLFNNV